MKVRINKLSDGKPYDPEEVKRTTVPNWFRDMVGPPLAAARHQDDINRWPWLFRWLHRTFISRRCPACIYWKEQQRPVAELSPEETEPPVSGSSLWVCDHCGVTGTWDEWKSSVEPGQHKCDVCLESGRSGIITPFTG